MAMNRREFKTWSEGRDLARYIIKRSLDTAGFGLDAVPQDIVNAARHVQHCMDEEDADFKRREANRDARHKKAWAAWQGNAK